jgi:hypothetical protein
MDSLTHNWLDAATIQLNKQELNKDQDDAIVQLFEVCSDDPKRAFNVICEILACNPRKDVVGYLGAGPLEDLLIHHCEYIDIVIEKTNSIELLEECLEHVNLETEDCEEAEKLHAFFASHRK